MKTWMKDKLKLLGAVVISLLLLYLAAQATLNAINAILANPPKMPVIKIELKRVDQ